MPQEAQGDNLLLGKGKLYFARRTGGTLEGERFLGNVTSIELTTTDESREKYSSAEQSSPLLKRANIRRTQELVATCDEFQQKNMALALMGDVSALAQGSGSVAAEAISSVDVDLYYPLAFRNVSNVVVTGSGGTPTYTVADDYVVDAVTGRIYVVDGGAIVAGTDLEVDYDYAADTSATVRSGVSNQIEGFLRFIGDPAAGPKKELEVWDVSIAPEGGIGLISDDFASFGLKFTVQADAENHPDEPYFRVIERA